jgi:hypothetical protein
VLGPLKSGVCDVAEVAEMGSPLCDEPIEVCDRFGRWRDGPPYGDSWEAMLLVGESPLEGLRECVKGTWSFGTGGGGGGA